MLLLALAIVVMLGRSLLKQYGFLGTAERPRDAAETTAAPVSGIPTNRASEIEDLMRQQLPKLDVESGAAR